MNIFERVAPPVFSIPAAILTVAMYGEREAHRLYEDYEVQLDGWETEGGLSR